ncbi:MAG TPA: DUF4105 domain-containing protein [Thermoanaerobaculia bacterium]
MRRFLLLAFAAVTLAVLSLVALRLTRSASNDRAWTESQRIAPRVTASDERVDIRNLRDFTWRSETDFDIRYEDRTYDLSELDSAWYVVSRFGSVPGLAHAFLSFGFGDEYVAVSVEARKEATESYSPIRGLLGQYELIYVIGTERDLIGLRTNVWREAVTLYPIRAGRETLQRTFLDIVGRAEKLAVEPELYDTLLNSCSSNIVRHVNTISPGQIRADLRTVLPGYSDRVAHELGMIDSDLPLERLRETFRIDAVAQRSPLDERFSRAIRQHLPGR